MFGKSEYKQMMDALYTYSFVRERSMGRASYVVSVEATDDFEEKEMAEITLECMKQNSHVRDMIQYNMRVFEIDDPTFSKQNFTEDQIWNYLFNIPEMVDSTKKSTDKLVEELK